MEEALEYEFEDLKADSVTVTMKWEKVAVPFKVSVTDQGNGIPSEHLERIFQLYFTTKENGTGLGLSLASRAIDLHSGMVDVKSAVGAGTTVRISLPIASEPPAGLAIATTASQAS